MIWSFSYEEIIFTLCPSQLLNAMNHHLARELLNLRAFLQVTRALLLDNSTTGRATERFTIDLVSSGIS